METVRIAGLVPHPPVRVRPETPLDECARLAIRHRVRYLAVVDAEERFLGLVADTDLFAHDALGESPIDRAVTATDLLAPAPLAVAPDDALAEVVRELAARRIDVAVILVAGRLVGVFTDEDAVGAAAEQLAETVLVQDVATRPVHAGQGDAPAYAAWTKMLGERIRHVVVVDA
jgi:CBS domain-containing protein